MLSVQRQLVSNEIKQGRGRSAYPANVFHSAKAADLLLFGVSKFLHRGLAGAQTVRGDSLRTAVPLHPLLHKLESGRLVPRIAGKGFSTSPSWSTARQS